MELMLLVWGIDLILKLKVFAAICAEIVGVVLCANAFVVTNNLMDGDDDAMDKHKQWFKKYCWHPKSYVIILLVLWIIPSSQTMKYMGGAYLAQTAFESDFVQQSATLSQKAILNKLQEWAEDAPELNDTLKELGVEMVDKVSEQLEESTNASK